jgi:hypothetical protein
LDEQKRFCADRRPADENVLWTIGTYWAFDEHQPRLPSALPATVDALCDSFASGDDCSFGPHLRSVGHRLLNVAGSVAAHARRLAPRTLCHGDAKGAHFLFRKKKMRDDGAMEHRDGHPSNSCAASSTREANCRNGDSSSHVKVIDFQWCGRYSPFVDVMYFVHGAVDVELLRDREEHYLEMYLQFLEKCNPALAENLRAVASWHYTVLLLQYAVVALGYFLKGATPATIEAERDNITELTHTRRVDDLKYFLECVDRALTRFAADEHLHQ